LAGMETILGGGGSTILYWLEKIDRFDRKFMQPVSCGREKEDQRLEKMLKHQNTTATAANSFLWGRSRTRMPRIIL